MVERELRRISDRRFIAFDWDKHWLRAFALARGPWSCFDLFPPVAGYRPYRGRRKGYYVSPSSQHGDWARVVRERDQECQICGSTDDLQAHHVWTQGAFHHLRYALRNGMTLCRWCHVSDPPTYNEISPNQFRWLSAEIESINANVQDPDFWEEYPAFWIGRLRLYKIKASEIDWEDPKIASHLRYFKTLAKLNAWVQAAQELAARGPFPDPELSLDPAFVDEISAHDPYADD